MDKNDQLKEALKSADTYPTGPVSAWPKERKREVLAIYESIHGATPGESEGASAEALQKIDPHKTIKANRRQMAGNLMRVAGQAIRHGKVSSEVREERYDTCKACPFFNAESKRCNDCGCFMEAKTWVGGDPKMLCPQEKWSR